jgi:S-formylglutathione hydrolase FrmB
LRQRQLLIVAVVAAVGLVFASGAAVVVASRAAPRKRRSAAQTLDITCRSPSLGGSLPAVVYLPSGYSSSSKRYRVIYFLHGLPAGPSSYKTNSFVAAALQSSGRRAIVVAPQGARNENSDREYLDWSPTENWPAAISHDLTRCIDQRFRTDASRSGRALIGLSAGGYGAFNIGLRTLDVFGAVESWSGYFVATDPSGYQVLKLGSAQDNAAARVPRGPRLRKELAAWPSLIAFYIGRQDSRFLQMNVQFDRQLTQNHIKHVFHTYTGGHSPSLWQSQAPYWLGMALDALAAESKRR